MHPRHLLGSEVFHVHVHLQVSIAAETPYYVSRFNPGVMSASDAVDGSSTGA
jgi:hypothetical protein